MRFPVNGVTYTSLCMNIIHKQMMKVTLEPNTFLWKIVCHHTTIGLVFIAVLLTLLLSTNISNVLVCVVSNHNRCKQNQDDSWNKIRPMVNSVKLSVCRHGWNLAGRKKLLDRSIRVETLSFWLPKAEVCCLLCAIPICSITVKRIKTTVIFVFCVKRAVWIVKVKRIYLICDEFLFFFVDEWGPIKCPCIMTMSPPNFLA